MRHAFVLILVLFLGIAGCSQITAGGDNGGFTDSPVSDYDSLVDALRATGATVEPAGAIEQPFFSVAGKVIRVDGVDVQVFEYADRKTAEEEASTISLDGTAIGTSMVSWIEPPHFYQGGKLIVLYVGADPNFKEVLSDVLGTQIAGGS